MVIKGLQQGLWASLTRINTISIAPSDLGPDGANVSEEGLTDEQPQQCNAVQKNVQEIHPDAHQISESKEHR